MKITYFFNLENPNDETKKYYLVMEYSDGGTLRYYLKNNFDKLTWENKCTFAFQLACAVSCLHSEGIVHRDLVILLNYDLIVKIIVIFVYIYINSF